MRIAIVDVVAEGSSYYLMNKLAEGLRRDGFTVDKYVLNSWLIPKLFIRDLKLLDRLEKYDIIIYGQSIAFITPLLVNKCKILFLHGVNYYDFYYTGFIHGRNIINKLTGLGFYSWWNILRSLPSMDYFVCHSRSACMSNIIPWEKTIILPQFILEDEIPTRRETNKVINDHALKIMTYTSTSKYSPRLLSQEIVEKIPFLLSKKLNNCVNNKRILFTIVSPGEHVRARIGCVEIHKLPLMPRLYFQNLLSRQHIYLERNLDEELGLTSIEAGLNGVAVAKITLPEYRDYADYPSKAVIEATSLMGLIDRLVEIIDNLGVIHEYLTNFYNFLVNKRVWGRVKKYLYSKIYDCTVK